METLNTELSDLAELPLNDYDFHVELVETAKTSAHDSGDPISHRLLNLCNRYIFGELTEEEFGALILGPKLQ